MKHLPAIFIVCFLLFTFSCSTDNQDVQSTYFGITVRVDPAVELFCIIYRLAGIDQYQVNKFPRYISDIENHFGQFRNHPAVKTAEKLRTENRINGSAPMALAVYLDAPPALEGRNTLDPRPDDLDSRWSNQIIKEFIEAAGNFSKDTNFMQFFHAHKELYDQCVQNLSEKVKNKNIIPWFNKYFGYEPETYTMIIGMQTGHGNYGLRITNKDGSIEYISIIGATTPWWRKTPRFSENWILPTVIHEFCHSYINPLVAEHDDELKEAGQTLFPLHRSKLLPQGYINYQIMFDEYLVRACTIRYLIEKKKFWQVEKQFRNDIKCGFPAIRGLVKIFDKYEENRETYRDMADFIPEIVTYFNTYAASNQ